jgi:alpha-N-arabinofuranosidase
MTTRSSTALAAIVLAWTIGGHGWPGKAQAPTQPANAGVVNASFEQSDTSSATGWKTAVFQRSAEFTIETAAHTGSRSARITSSEGGDAAWTAIAPVRPYARYRLSAWIKTDRVEAGTGMGALLNLHGLGRTHTDAVTGTRDWTKVTLEFDTEGNDAVQINCLLGGWGRSRGTAWFDDVALEMLTARTLAPAAIVDAGSPRAPMSKYIYGQFIEHLGRCIYGGIWAEMLEDRKFFYPVAEDESPWTLLGEPRAVVMTTTKAFVGEHSPEFELDGSRPSGITQTGLAVVADARYRGRVVLAGDSAAGPVDVSLVWGQAASSRQTVTIRSFDERYRTYPIAFEAGASSDDARLEIVGRGKGRFRIGTVSLMPANNVEGFRPDVLALLRELNAPVYRWPGGNFVSGYNWRDGVGDADRRPPRKNPAWKGVEHNDVGLHEFMTLCRLIGAEPYLAVNSGLGDSTSAAAEVEYANGAPNTPMGAQRALNGHQAPFKVRWWSIGNEMYGDWQLGHMPIASYVKRHAEFAAAMRAKDPSIELIAVGDVGAWDEAMLAGNAGNMSLISEHFYVQEAPGLMGHVAQVPQQIRRIADAHRRYRTAIPELAGKSIRIALDEWNYWYGPHLYGELGTRYFLKDALGIAAGIHEYSRQADMIFMANYAQTVNVIGAIKTTKTAAAFDATGLVLKLYRANFGQVPVAITGAPEPLDVAAAWRDDRSALTLAIVNPTAEPQALALQLKGADFALTATLRRIAGTDPLAYNEPGKPPALTIQETANVPVGERLMLPPMSISIYELRTR